MSTNWRTIQTPTTTLMIKYYLLCSGTKVKLQAWTAGQIWKIKTLIYWAPTVLMINGPAHDKTNKMAYVPSEDSDQPGHLPSLINLCCALSGELRTQAFFTGLAKTLIRLGSCPGWSVFAGCTCHFVGFVVRWLKFKYFSYFSIKTYIASTH